jgi:hypothetical protein
MSPVVFRAHGIKFHFFANEGNPREPAHIHAERPGAKAKLWLHPQVSVAHSFGYNRHELSMLVRLVEARRCEIEKVWNEFFSDGGQI